MVHSLKCFYFFSYLFDDLCPFLVSSGKPVDCRHQFMAWQVIKCMSTCMNSTNEEITKEVQRGNFIYFSLTIHLLGIQWNSLSSSHHVNHDFKCFAAGFKCTNFLFFFFQTFLIKILEPVTRSCSHLSSSFLNSNMKINLTNFWECMSATKEK